MHIQNVNWGESGDTPGCGLLAIGFLACIAMMVHALYKH